MSLACDGVHDADDMVPGGGLRHADISVSKENDPVGVDFYDPVDEIVSVDVPDKGHSAFAYVFSLPRAQGHLVAQVHHEWIHAVALDSDGDCLALRDQGPDLLHHYRFVYRFGRCHSSLSVAAG